MVVFTIGKKRAAKIAAISVFAVFLTALCVIIALERKEAVPDYATADEIGRFFTEAADTDAQVEFLSQFGIKVNTKTKQSDTITIPLNFDNI